MHDNHSTPDQERYRYLFYSVVALLIFLFSFAAWSMQHPQGPQGDWVPHPDPTPYAVDRGWEIHIGSDNCIGWTVSCNNQ